VEGGDGGRRIDRANFDQSQSAAATLLQTTLLFFSSDSLWWDWESVSGSGRLKMLSTLKYFETQGEDGGNHWGIVTKLESQSAPEKPHNK
jgi:hypothetical protein